MHPKMTAHPIALQQVSLGVPAFRQDADQAVWKRRSLKLVNMCKSAEEEKNPKLPKRQNPAQILLEDLLMLNHTATETPLSRIRKQDCFQTYNVRGSFLNNLETGLGVTWTHW